MYKMFWSREKAAVGQSHVCFVTFISFSHWQPPQPPSLPSGKGRKFHCSNRSAEMDFGYVAWQRMGELKKEGERVQEFLSEKDNVQQLPAGVTTAPWDFTLWRWPPRRRPPPPAFAWGGKNCKIKQEGQGATWVPNWTRDIWPSIKIRNS